MALGLYVVQSDGSYYFGGRRPDVGWHRHGVLVVGLEVLRARGLVTVQLRKQRWLRYEDAVTCHSRPPDVLGSCRFCSMFIVLVVFGWLDGAQGLCTLELPGLVEARGRPSRRTVQRWCSRLAAVAVELEHAVRAAVRERGEPRPDELRLRLCTAGRSPPFEARRGWKDAAAVRSLWQALRQLIGGALALDVPATTLWAEARARMRTEQP